MCRLREKQLCTCENRKAGWSYTKQSAFIHLIIRSYDHFSFVLFFFRSSWCCFDFSLIMAYHCFNWPSSYQSLLYILLWLLSQLQCIYFMTSLHCCVIWFATDIFEWTSGYTDKTCKKRCHHATKDQRSIRSKEGRGTEKKQRDGAWSHVIYNAQSDTNTSSSSASLKKKSM